MRTSQDVFIQIGTTEEQRYSNCILYYGQLGKIEKLTYLAEGIYIYTPQQIRQSPKNYYGYS